jgi:uncharacterized protein (TIGR02147 family)
MTQELIAQKLRLSSQDVQTIVDDLAQRGFLTLDELGRPQTPLENLATVNDVPSAAVVRLHKAHLDLAKLAVEKLPPMQREFQTLTLSGSSAAMVQIKNEVRAFSERVAHILNKDKENDQVFRFSVQLFPMEMGDN